MAIIRMQKCGTWRWNQSAGVYLEAINVPPGAPRYTLLDTWGASHLPEGTLRQINQGTCVDMDIDTDDLYDRIDAIPLRG